MSNSALYKVMANGDVLEHKEYRNGHGFAMPAWSYLAQKHLERRRGEDDNQFWARWFMTENCKSVWALQRDSKLPHLDRVILTTSFDNAMVRKENFLDLADVFEEFGRLMYRMSPEKVCHYGGMGREIRKLADEKDVQAVAWMATSVGEDPWVAYDECTCSCGHVHQKEESRPYNIKQDKKHWFVYDALAEREKEWVS